MAKFFKKRIAPVFVAIMADGTISKFTDATTVVATPVMGQTIAAKSMAKDPGTNSRCYEDRIKLYIENDAAETTAIKAGFDWLRKQFDEAATDGPYCDCSVNQTTATGEKGQAMSVFTISLFSERRSDALEEEVYKEELRKLNLFEKKAMGLAKKPAPAKSTNPAPTKGTPGPAKGTNPDPAKGTNPDPTKGSNPAPTKGSNPDPTKGSNPAPTKGSNPAPTKGSNPAPAKGTNPDPTKGSNPDPAKGSNPDPTKGSNPAPAKGTNPDPAKKPAPPTPPTTSPLADFDGWYAYEMAMLAYKKANQA